MEDADPGLPQFPHLYFRRVPEYSWYQLRAYLIGGQRKREESHLNPGHTWPTTGEGPSPGFLPANWPLS